ncbi:MAG: response regulator [Proteobacteria bacterium]|nr:response regulator [Pseudomonadota bacterium]
MKPALVIFAAEAGPREVLGFDVEVVSNRQALLDITTRRRIKAVLVEEALLEETLVHDLRIARPELVAMLLSRRDERRLLLQGFDGTCSIDDSHLGRRLLHLHQERKQRCIQERKLILVVDDDLDLLCTVEDALARAGYVVWAITNPWDALRALRHEGFRVLLSDIRMPHIDGDQLVASAAQYDPFVVPVLITGYPSMNVAIQAVRGPANNLLLKPLKMQTLLEAVGRAWDQSAALTSCHREQPETSLPSLSQRENQVLRLIAVGHTNREAAQQLSLSVKTIDTYRERLMKKLDVKSRADLVRIAKDLGWLDADLI